jgi:hypothetical protein
MMRFMPFGFMLILLGSINSGCSLLYINDPNSNDKIRYSMAHAHAERGLREAGSKLHPYSPDYDVMVFWRRHYDEKTQTIHDCQLYDFLKTSRQPGPDRFVIAYDMATRKTYLRTDLRSDVNIESLPSRKPAFAGE